MKRLQAIVTPLSHLSYRGSLPRARSEQGFFKETTRLEHFNEELFRIRVGDAGEEARQLCVSTDAAGSTGIHLLLSSYNSFGLCSFVDRGGGGGQEERLFVPLGDSIPGGGGGNTQIEPFNSGSNIALFLPSWDSVFLLSPYGGKCDTIRLGKNSSVFSARRPRANETLMFSNSLQTQLYFCGVNTLRILQGDELITIDLQLALSSKSFASASMPPCTIRPIGDDEFFVQSEERPYEAAFIRRIDSQEWVWQPVAIDNKNDETKEWSMNKLGRSASSYIHSLLPHAQERSSVINTWEVLTSVRPTDTLKGKEGYQNGGLKSGSEKWASSEAIVASVSPDESQLEIVNLKSQAIRTIHLGSLARSSASTDTVESIAIHNEKVYLLTRTKAAETSNWIRVFEANDKMLEKQLTDWKRMWGLPTEDPLRGTIQNQLGREGGQSKTPPKASNPKHGKVDSEFHAGGNTFAGGTGGADTAGLGGRGGPYRLDKGHRIHQISDELKSQVDKEVQDKARQLGKLAWEERLKEIKMNPNAHKAYVDARERIQADLIRLRSVLEASSLVKKERLWIRNQSFGEMDDSRIVDGLVGDRLIFKRRAFKDPPPGTTLSSPINIRIVVDISGSMYRFQSLDGRLQRMLDTTLMMLEALRGLEHQFRVSLAGHSGESPSVPLVEWDQVPQNESEIYKVLETMAAHAQYCISGDHTVEAVYEAVEQVLEEDPESGGIAIIVSDANLRRYGIAPSELATAMRTADNVKTHVVFVASVRDEADTLVRELPFGKARVCLDTTDLPHVMRDILADASLTM